ncbi:unnamed protein product [Linum trigynum]|uniref:Uncharacterized protein n=1 Tax=Linum trigynum TaxID=586398 RepID=A0AAV2CQR5_9ROSI
MMAKAVKIEVTSRQMIKPSSPTPPEKSSLKLSIMDELNYVTATPLTLFYPAPDAGQQDVTVPRPERLKSSLADALTLYYPYAGELRASNVIECNDAGIEFVECNVAGTLSDVVFRCPDLDLLDSFLSIDDLNSADRYVGGQIKTLAFSCGGLAVAISMTHKVGDGISMFAFIRAWVAAAVAKENSTTISSEHHPTFASNSIVPSSSDLAVPLPRLPPAQKEQIKATTRRFVIEAEAIKRIQARCVSDAVERPTRSEALTAIVWRSLMKINRAKRIAAGRQGHKEKSILIQATNWRQQLDPPLPRTLVGNLSGKFVCRIEEGSSKDLKALAAYLRAGQAESGKPMMKGNNLAEEEAQGIIEFVREVQEVTTRGDVDIYSFSSLLSSFRLYDIDFGWGKPAWVVFTNLIIKNYVIFIEDIDRSVEILISTGEDDGRMLENDEELLEFASVNPPVVRGLRPSVALQSRI